MRTLITGATGFIGSHAAEALLAAGHDVVCPVRDPARFRHLVGAGARTIPVAAMEEILSAEPAFDYVYHVAGATRARDYQGFHEGNVTYTQRMIDLCLKPAQRERLKRFVLVSSQAAAGPAPIDGTPVTENDTARPLSSYGKSKLAAEELVMSHADRMAVTVVRPPTVFGPRDVDVLAVFRCARYRVAPCLAGPDRFVSIVYVSDLVDGMIAAAEFPQAAGQVYFLANPEPVIWRSFSLHVADILGYRARAMPLHVGPMKVFAKFCDLMAGWTETPPLFRSEKLNEMCQIAWVCSPEKARRHFKWIAQTPLTTAVIRTADWYHRNGWL